jgi:hypothetical protein
MNDGLDDDFGSVSELGGIQGAGGSVRGEASWAYKNTNFISWLNSHAARSHQS